MMGECFDYMGIFLDLSDSAKTNKIKNDIFFIAKSFIFNKQKSSLCSQNIYHEISEEENGCGV